MVGAQIIVVSALSAATPALAPALASAQARLRRSLRCCWPAAARRAVTQRPFSRAWVAAGGEFGLAERYGLLLTATFGCLAFASGMPILLLVAALVALLTYWADRYHLLRLARRPPPYSGRLGRTALNSLEFALLLHLLVGIWMYSATASDGTPMLPRPFTGPAPAAILAATGAPRTGLVARVLNDLTFPMAALAAVTAAAIVLRVTGGLAFVARAVGLRPGAAAAARGGATATYAEALREGLPGFAAGYDLTRLPPHDEVR